MRTEIFPAPITPTGQTMDRVVFNTRASHIAVVIGEGMRGVKSR